MPLYSIPSMKIISQVPHELKNRPIINRISPQELDAIKAEINNRVDNVVDSPEELITSGWIPGRDWSGTVWDPIYLASEKNTEVAGMVFGSIVFEVMIDRSEDWSLGKYEVNGRKIGSITYFRIKI